MLLHRSGLAQQVQLLGSQSGQQHNQQRYNKSDVAAGQSEQQLTAQQQQDLTAAVLSSFKSNSKSSCDLLLKNLNNESKKYLLAALEDAHEQQRHLSRAAMADAIPAKADTPPLPKAIVPTSPVTPASDVPAPTTGQLFRVAATKGIPFVAFGFFDNMIMITAGEQIDLMFGAKLGLSSMAAAGLGNTVADVVGINISHTIEQKFKNMKSMAAPLTKAQMQLPQARRATWLGCALGMATGCLLGLTPLLFFGTESHHKDGGSSGSSSAGSSSDSSSSSGGGSMRPATAGAAAG